MGAAASALPGAAELRSKRSIACSSSSCRCRKCSRPWAEWRGWRAEGNRRAEKRLRCCGHAVREATEWARPAYRSPSARAALTWGLPRGPGQRAALQEWRDRALRSIEEVVRGCYSFASRRFEETSVLSRRGHRFPERPGQPLRRDPRLLQSALEAGHRSCEEGASRL